MISLDMKTCLMHLYLHYLVFHLHKRNRNDNDIYIFHHVIFSDNSAKFWTMTTRCKHFLSGKELESLLLLREDDLELYCPIQTKVKDCLVKKNKILLTIYLQSLIKDKRVTILRTN